MRGLRFNSVFLGHGFLFILLALLNLSAVLFSTGCTGMVQGTPPGGGTLTISNAAAANATMTTAVVTWQTSAPANSQVEYGTTTAYGSMTALDTTMVASHQVTMSSLKPGTTYHYRVHSTDANSQSAVSGDLTFATAADTTPPTVSITAPTASATLSGTVSVTASASDDVAVASVQFKVDSANTGSAITAAPYTLALDTTKLSDGNHLLTAVATDTSGNAATSAGVTVKVNNAAPAPAIASLNPTSGVVGAAVTITGANFGATQGTSTVKFNGTTATVTSWSATSIATSVPAGATTGNVVVTVGGVDSNGANFTVTVPVPSITSLNPTSGVIGTVVTITGANFGAAQGSSMVTFNGIAATVTSWSATSIVTSVPAGATTGNVVLTVGGVVSNGINFTVTVPVPSITSLNPTSGVVGTAVTITGANFGATQGSSTVTFNGMAATVTSWSATNIVTSVPAGATTGSVVVTVGGVSSNGVLFTVLSHISSLNPTSGSVGTSVTISGSNFGATQGSSTVTFNGTATAPTSWNATTIVAPVPSGATTGNVVVTVGGFASNGVTFTVSAGPGISSLNPTSGPVGTSVTIAGSNFGASQGTSTVTFNGTLASPTSWNATSIVVSVPSGATTGSVVVTVGAVASNGVAFTVLVAPGITSLSPASGPVGTSVTIGGSNFGATQGSSTVSFNTTMATATSWSATSIVTSVPTGATTGNVVVTVGGVASKGVSFTVTADTTPPVVTITAPVNNATVSGTITLTATATDPDSAVSLVQFQIDGANSGAQLTSAPYSLSLDTTTVTNGTHTLTAVAQDPTGNKGTSAAVSITVSNSTSSSMGPLKQSTVNTRYFVAPSGKAVFLSGSHTWNNFQDTDTNVSSTPAAMDFTTFVNMLKQDGHNATILWHKDLPEYCGWNFSGSVWRMDPWPWLRPGPGVATDGGAKFDLTQFNQPYFDRLRARVQQLQQNGIYAIIELFDANQLTSARCSTDGYPYSGPNNINGVSDGYSSGASGTSSYTMTTNNAITNIQDAYVKKVVDTLNDLPNVIWEVAEEQPAGSMTWWAPHVMGLLRAYEGGGTFEGTTYNAKPFQHTVGIGSLNATAPNDATLYASAADWIAPTVNTNFSNQFPSNVSTNNQGKVVINDSDHALGYKSFLNSNGTVQDQNLRGYLWENLTNGAEGVIFMDPYEIFWQGSPVRNTCLNPANQVCTGGPDAKYNNFRLAMGYLENFANTNLNLLKMTPQNSLSSTGHCLADNSATGAEYLVYAPSGGTFTVNLTATTRALNVQWLNPATGAITTGAGVTGGTTPSFTPPFSGDAVLYIVDAAGHN